MKGIIGMYSKVIQSCKVNSMLVPLKESLTAEKIFSWKNSLFRTVALPTFPVVSTFRSLGATALERHWSRVRSLVQKEFFFNCEASWENCIFFCSFVMLSSTIGEWQLSISLNFLRVAVSAQLVCYIWCTLLQHCTVDTLSAQSRSDDLAMKSCEAGERSENRFG